MNKYWILILDSIASTKDRESPGPYHASYYAHFYHFFSKFGHTYHSSEEMTKPSIEETWLRKLSAIPTKQNIRVKQNILRFVQNIPVAS